MSKINERKASIEQVIELAQESDAIGALVVYGDGNTESGDLRIDALPAEGSSVMIAYTRFSYLISSELGDGQLVERDSERRVKKISLDNGVELTLGVTNFNNLAAKEWYRIVFDDIGLAEKLPDSVPEDILCDTEKPAPEPEAPAPAEDDFDDIEPEVVAPVVIPAAAPAEEPEPAEEADETDKYVEYVSRNLKNAQRAIASGQMIRAGEIVAVLRKMAIELICVRNGVTEDFEQAIDFIDCEEKHMLMKAYPRNMDQKSLAGALASLSELFDRLI